MSQVFLPCVAGPLAAAGAVAQPIFFAPLTHSLVPTSAGNPAATFTRATTAYVSAVAPGGNAVDGQVLILCAANEPRFHGARRISANNWSNLYTDGTPIPLATTLGYLAENAATNLCKYSQEFDQAGFWIPLNTDVTPNTQIAPDGTLTADTYADNATNGSHQRGQTMTVAAGLVTASIYVKQGTLPWMQLSAYDGTARWANFNLATGAVGFTGGITSTAVQALPNGWFRVSVTYTTATTTITVSPIPLQSNLNANGPSYVGTGQTMFLWGAQVEQAAFASSYIPTTTVATVRNVDVLTYPLATNASRTVGTAYAELSCFWTAVPSGINTRALAIGTNDAANALFGLTQFELPTELAIIDGAGTVKKSGLTSMFTGVRKRASTWSIATSTKTITGDGAAVATGSFAAFATTPDVLAISPSSHPWRGTVRNVKIYATALTDVELIAMTTP